MAIRNARPGAKAYKLADGAGKLWRLKYRIDGREKLLALGAYPEIGLSDARKRREDARALLAQGKNPTRDLRGARTAPTVTLCGAITDAAKVAGRLAARHRWL